MTILDIDKALAFVFWKNWPGLCVLLPLENLLWSKSRDCEISRVNPNSRQVFLMWVNLISFSLLPLSFLFLNLSDYHVVRELMRGGMGSRAGWAGTSLWLDLPVSGRVEVPPGSDLPLNRILYIPFSIFVYSSNNVIANLVRSESMLVEGTLKYSRFALSSSSFRDRAPTTKLCWCTTQPECCMTLPSADRRDSYCATVTSLALTT
jgi:hypothetical protein